MARDNTMLLLHLLIMYSPVDLHVFICLLAKYLINYWTDFNKAP